MIQHETPSCTIGMVTVHPDASDFIIIHNGTRLAYFNPIYMRYDLPPGNWQIMGLASELTEEQWKGVVERNPDCCYINYLSPVNHAATIATESGLSLLAHYNMQKETTLIIIKKK